MLGVVAGLDANRGAKRAREARRELGLDPGAPLACLLDIVESDAGLPVVVAALPAGLAGACTRLAGGVLLFVNGTQAPVRQRFTLAHELGHAWCKHDGQLAVDTFATLSGKTTNPLEIQANAFAAEFLIPRTALEQLIDGEPTLEHIVVIAAHYGTSAIMTLFRLKQLGLASEKRLSALESEIGENLHAAAFDRLGLAALDDRLGRLEHLPHLSAALQATKLGAVIRGDAAAEPALATAISRLLR